jgi:hypothetical protein
MTHARHDCGTAVRKPVRLVVHLANADPGRGYGKPANFQWKYRLLAESLRRARSGISVLGMLLISFPDDTPHHALEAQIPTIGSALGLNDKVKISFDTRWSTINLANSRFRTGSA